MNYKHSLVFLLYILSAFSAKFITRGVYPSSHHRDIKSFLKDSPTIASAAESLLNAYYNSSESMPYTHIEGSINSVNVNISKGYIVPSAKVSPGSDTLFPVGSLTQLLLHYSMATSSSFDVDKPLSSYSKDTGLSATSRDILTYKSGVVSTPTSTITIDVYDITADVKPWMPDSSTSLPSYSAQAIQMAGYVYSQQLHLPLASVFGTLFTKIGMTKSVLVTENTFTTFASRMVTDFDQQTCANTEYQLFSLTPAANGAACSLNDLRTFVSWFQSPTSELKSIQDSISPFVEGNNLVKLEYKSKVGYLMNFEFYGSLGFIFVSGDDYLICVTTAVDETDSISLALRDLSMAIWAPYDDRFTEDDSTYNPKISYLYTDLDYPKMAFYGKPTLYKIKNPDGKSLTVNGNSYKLVASGVYSNNSLPIFANNSLVSYDYRPLTPFSTLDDPRTSLILFCLGVLFLVASISSFALMQTCKLHNKMTVDEDITQYRFLKMSSKLTYDMCTGAEVIFFAIGITSPLFSLLFYILLRHQVAGFEGAYYGCPRPTLILIRYWQISGSIAVFLFSVFAFFRALLHSNRTKPVYTFFNFIGVIGFILMYIAAYNYGIYWPRC